ncbi:MAG: sulfite exporter TauE/SafE family protein, partial [Chloroflexi bacterium]
AMLRKSPAQGMEKKTVITWRTLASITFIQLIVAIYGGYFGGGIGIMILASLGVMGMDNIHEMNGLKTVLQSLINGVAVITFIIASAVVWLPAMVMIVGAIVGGFGGAYVARRLDARLIRGFVILVGVSMTIYFFLRSIGKL